LPTSSTYPDCQKCRKVSRKLGGYSSLCLDLTPGIGDRTPLLSRYCIFRWRSAFFIASRYENAPGSLGAKRLIHDKTPVFNWPIHLARHAA
jgi:hypothetical protein